VPKILLFHPEAFAYAKLVRGRIADVDLIATRDEAEFRHALPSAEILVADRFPVDALASAASLRWIQITIAGTEFLAPVREQIGHLMVTNGRGIHAAPIADYVLAAMTMLISDFPGLLRDQAEKRWRRRPVTVLARHTLGIVGLGAIGQEIARRARICGMEVIGVRRSGAPLAGLTKIYPPQEIHRFLACCDFVVLAVPVTDGTRGMIGAPEFAAMKPTAFIINVARGAVIDEPAMVEALMRRTIAGACLDVFAVEPLPQDSPLWAMRNVMVTPHIAGMRADYGERFMDILVENLSLYSRRETLRNVVDFSAGY
jgi:phosphoglycerate dehydrogenase-like enzyme